MSKPEDTSKAIHVAIVTISDTRTKKDDKSGNLIAELLHEAGHHIVNHDIVIDDQNKIQNAVKRLVNDDSVDIVLTNGGTGISHRDVTIEAIEPLLDKTIPGFGEVFRTLSYYEDIGSGAIMSRAIAGVSNHKAIFVMPGSSAAVKLAMNKLIIPELHHVYHEITKDL